MVPQRQSVVIVVQDVSADVWSAELEEVLVRIAHRFGRVDLRRRTRAYVHGCLGPWARRTFGSSPGTPATPCPTGCSTCPAGPAGTPTKYATSCRNTLPTDSETRLACELSVPPGRPRGSNLLGMTDLPDDLVQLESWSGIRKSRPAASRLHAD